MLFNSLLFLLVFLPLVVAIHYLLPGHRARLVFLIVASYVFYGYARWWFPLLMLGETVAAFAAGIAIERLRDRPSQRKLVLAAGIAVCLAFLGFFKYAGFVSGYVSGLVALITAPGLPGLKSFANTIALPAGISFFTFEAISYMVDVYRSDLDAERNPLRFALFISFFPHLIAGPIVRYGILRPQLEHRHRFDPETFRSGLMLMSVGLAKKVLLADRIAFRIDPLFATPAHFGFVDGWMAILGYSFQIYLDFSAYSDMALGLARLFGISLPFNFDRPYRAATPSEFWRRWHVTLSSWLRDYLYIPLGGNRKGERRRDLNLFVTMGLGGLWHGASLNFVTWGLYHGGLLAGHRRLAGRFSVPRVAANAITFVLVTLGWVFFRLHHPTPIGQMFAALAGLHGLGSPLTSLAVYLLLAAVLMWGIPEEWSWSFSSWGWSRVAALALLTGYTILAVGETTTFIYFRF